MRLTALILCFSLLITFSVTSQEHDLQPIAPHNAAQIQELDSIGGLLPADLAWSPDGTVLAVGTSEDIRLFAVNNLDTPAHIIPENGTNIFFNPQGELIVNGERWNSESGERIGAIESNPTVNSGILSPDRKYKAIVVTDSTEEYPILTVQLWQVEPETLVAEMPLTLEILEFIAFHADGKLLVTGVSTDDIYGSIFEDVQIWDGRTGERIGPSVYSYLPVRVSPDGQLLAFMMGEGVVLWTDHELGILEYYTDSESADIFFTSDGNMLITTSYEEVMLWDLSETLVTEQPRQVLSTEGLIYKVLYSPDGLLLVTAESGDIMEAWNLPEGTRRWQVAHPNLSTSVQFSPDGRLLRIILLSGRSLILDSNSGETLFEIPQSAVLNVDWTWAAYWDGENIQLVNMLTGEETSLSIIENYLGRIMAFHPFSEMVIFTDGDVRFYDLTTGELIFTQPTNDRISSAAFNENGDYFLIGMRPIILGPSDMMQLNIWYRDNLPQPITTLQLAQWGRDWLLSPDGKYLSQLMGSCGESGGSHSILDAMTGMQLFNERMDCGPYSHLFSPDGQWLIVSTEISVDIIHIGDGIEQVTPNENSPIEIITRNINPSSFTRIGEIVLSPDGTKLAASSLDNWVYVFEFSDLISDMDQNALSNGAIKIPGAQDMLFSSDNQWLWTDNGFWNAETGEQLVAYSSELGAFNTDSTVLAIYESDMVKLWNVSELSQGEAALLISFHIDAVESIYFNADSTRLYIKRAGEMQTWGVPAEG